VARQSINELGWYSARCSAITAAIVFLPDCRLQLRRSQPEEALFLRLGLDTQPGAELYAVQGEPQIVPKVVVDEVDPPLRCLPSSITLETSGHPACWPRMQKRAGSNITAYRYNGSLLLMDIEVESSARKYPLKQRF
jgi:hypothetical protein